MAAADVRLQRCWQVFKRLRRFELLIELVDDFVLR